MKVWKQNRRRRTFYVNLTEIAKCEATTFSSKDAKETISLKTMLIKLIEKVNNVRKKSQRDSDKARRRSALDRPCLKLCTKHLLLSVSTLQVRCIHAFS
jgi:hypothetical protein